MPEPVTTLGLGAIAAYLGKDGLEKLLGPTAAYLGDEARDFVQARKETIGRIFRNASNKAGNKLEKPGKVPPKVLNIILNDGSFATDDLAVEYLGGVLASSRTELGRDDRGARISKFIDLLSTYQLRAHFLIYGSIKHLFSDKSLSLNLKDRPKMRIYIPLSAFVEAMSLSADEINQITPLISHIFFGLARDGLIDEKFYLGPTDFIKTKYSRASESGIICQPSAFGAELFLWAFGRGDKQIDFLFDKSFVPVIEGCPSYYNGVKSTNPEANKPK